MLPVLQRSAQHSVTHCRMLRSLNLRGFSNAVTVELNFHFCLSVELWSRGEKKNPNKLVSSQRTNIFPLRTLSSSNLKPSGSVEMFDTYLLTPSLLSCTHQTQGTAGQPSWWRTLHPHRLLLTPHSSGLQPEHPDPLAWLHRSDLFLTLALHSWLSQESTSGS